MTVLPIPTTFSNDTSVDYSTTAIEYSRQLADYNKFVMHTNYGNIIFQDAQPDVYGNKYDNDAGMPTDLQAVALSYYAPVYWTESPDNPFSYDTSTTVTVSSTTERDISASLGVAGGGVSATINAAFKITNTITQTGTISIPQTFPNARGVERIYVAWLQHFMVAICANGTSTPWAFDGGVKDNAPWFHRKSGGNREISYNTSRAWVDLPSQNHAWAVYDIDGNFIPHVR